MKCPNNIDICPMDKCIHWGEEIIRSGRMTRYVCLLFPKICKLNPSLRNHYQPKGQKGEK
jgi:hypothetical protein